MNRGFDEDGTVTPETERASSSHEVSIDLQADEIIEQPDNSPGEAIPLSEYYNFRKVQQAKAVVKVRDAVKKYGSGPTVLNKFCMTVERGTM